MSRKKNQQIATATATERMQGKSSGVCYLTEKKWRRKYLQRNKKLGEGEHIKGKLKEETYANLVSLCSLGNENVKRKAREGGAREIIWMRINVGCRRWMHSM